MNIEIPDRIAPYVTAAIRQFTRQLARDGHVPPPELAVVADQLRHAGERDELARKRALSAARSARYRARQRQRREQQAVA